MGVEGLDGLRDANREDASRMECLTQLGVIDAEIPGQRVDGQRGPPRDALDSLLRLCRARATHSWHHWDCPRGNADGKDEARGGLRIMPGLRPNWAGQLLLPLHDGSNRGIVGIDDFTLGRSLCPG